MREEVYHDNYIIIVKDIFHGQSYWNGVAEGQVRFWLYNADGTKQYYHDEKSKKEGYQSIGKRSDSILCLEFTTGRCYLMNVHGKLLTPKSFESVSFYVNGFAEVTFGKNVGHNCIDCSGRLFLELDNGCLCPLPIDCYGGAYIDEHHLALCHWGQRDLYLYDDSCQPILAERGWNKSIVHFSSWEKGPSPWCIYLTVRNERTIAEDYCSLLFNLYTNSFCQAMSLQFVNTGDRANFQSIGHNCIHLTEVIDNEERVWDSDERKELLYRNQYVLETLFFRSGQSFIDNCKIECLHDRELILIHGGPYVKYNDEHTSLSGCISYEGEVIVPVIFTEISLSGRLLTVKLGEKEFDYSFSGSILYHRMMLPKGIHVYSELGGNRLLVQHYTGLGNNSFLFGLFDVSLMAFILPMEYTSFTKSEDAYIICKDEKYGLLDEDFQELIPCNYSSLTPINRDKFIVSVKNGPHAQQFGIVSRTNKSIIRPKFHEVSFAGVDRLQFESYRDRSIETVTDFNLNTIIETEGDSFKLNGFWELISGFWGDSDFSSFVSDDERWGIISRFSVVVTQNSYDKIDVSGIKGVYIGRIDEQIYFLNPGRRIEKRINCDKYWTREKSEATELLYVSKGGYIGLVNVEGDFVLDCIYSEIWIQTDCIEIERNNLHGKADLNGNIIVPCEYFRYDQLNNGYYRAYNKYVCLLSPYGYPVVPLSESYHDILETEAKCLKTVTVNDVGERYYGLISLTGKIKRKADLSHIGPFINGEAIANFGGVKLSKYDASTRRNKLILNGGKFGIIDENGNFIIEPVYDSVGDENEGYRTVSMNNMYGIIDRNGKMTIECRYSFARSVVNGLVVFAVGGEWRKEGFDKEKLPVSLYDDNKYLVGAKWGIVDIKGRIIVEPNSDFMQRISEGKVTFRINDRYGVIDLESGDKHLTEYNFLSWFREGRCVAGKFNEYGHLKFGYIKDDISELVSCRYEKAFSYEKGQGYLIDRGNHYIADLDGEVTFDYSDYESMDDAIDWERETWYAMTGGQYGDYPGPGVDYDF